MKTTQIEEMINAYKEMNTANEHVVVDESGRTWYIADAEIAKKFKSGDDIYESNVDATLIDDDNHSDNTAATIVENVISGNTDYADESDLQYAYGALVNKESDSLLTINSIYNMHYVYDQGREEYELEQAKKRCHIAELEQARKRNDIA